jgi:hypothetical protein
MRNGVRGSDSMSDTVAQPHTATEEEGKQRSVAREEQLRPDLGVIGISFRLRKVGEEVFDCFEAETLGGHLGRNCAVVSDVLLSARGLTHEDGTSAPQHGRVLASVTLINIAGSSVRRDLLLYSATDSLAYGWHFRRHR